MRCLSKIRKLDIFRKIPEELSEKTNLGGIISIITIVAIIVVIYREFSNYLNQQYAAKISFDKYLTREEMTINLDIEFPSFPCEIISLDLEDIMISHHPNIGSVEKWRLDRDGNYLDNNPYQFIPVPGQQDKYLLLNMIRHAFNNSYGCRLIGSFKVKQVPGNFHVSLHPYHNYFWQLKKEGVVRSLNMSHIIHKLYFGTEHNLQKLKASHPDTQIHLLKNTTFIDNQDKIIKYFIDIVPTWYYQSSESKFYSYQYIYQKHIFKSSLQDPSIYAVYFNYNIGGLIVEIQQRQQEFSYFLIHLCAVIGGTYAICKIFYNIFSKFLSKFTFRKAPSSQMIQLKQ